MSSAAIIHGAISTVGPRSFPAAKGDDLLVRLRRREPHALADLYDRYSGVVFSLVLRIVGDRGIAEDLVQEAFLRVWSRAADLDPERVSAGPWLLAVARNRAIDYLRVQGRQSKRMVQVDEAETPALFIDIPSGTPDFDLARQVKRAFEHLSPQQRQAFELSYFEGLTQAEVAERMHQPLGTVKTWMRRGFEQMRAALNPGGMSNG